MSGAHDNSVFIIGATGTIGSRVLARLRPDHDAGRLRLHGAARSDGAALAVREAGATPVRFDLDDRLIDPRRQVEALAGIDTVFLLTGYTVDMLAQSKAVIDAAVAAGVGHVVHLGLMALPDTPGIHQGWHQMIEAYLERSGLGWTHLHPTMFTNSFVTLQRATGVYPVPPSGPVTFKGFYAGDVPVSWIDMDDIAEAAATVLRAPSAHHGKSYKLAVERNDFNALVAQAGEYFGREITYEMLPVEAMEAQIYNSGMDRKYAESGVNTIRMVNNGLLSDFGDVHDDFQRLTGRRPVLWADIFRRNPEWFVTADTDPRPAPREPALPSDSPNS